MAVCSPTGQLLTTKYSVWRTLLGFGVEDNRPAKRAAQPKLEPE